jgi:hypothetical protein
MKHRTTLVHISHHKQTVTDFIYIKHVLHGIFTQTQSILENWSFQQMQLVIFNDFFNVSGELSPHIFCLPANITNW